MLIRIQPPGANAHHLALIADPQLVDPHTYPGRPWPLSALTVVYTDLYLKRVYTLLQRHLYPDTTMFLGDLFDGGREWSVNSGAVWTNPTKAWQGYGEQFWLNEYNRFGKIFFDTFTKVGVTPRPGQGDRRQLIASLPGNHDLGFGTGVQLAVRERFEAYFGEGNRVDTIGNHSFISVDGVSLSAKDHPSKDADAIWQPTAAWLATVEQRRVAAIAKDLKKQFGETFAKRYEHTVFNWEQLEGATLPNITDLDSSGYPAVLISHVPLYRDPDTPCGPLRERHPQGRDPKTGRLKDKDRDNSILVQAGYQYQNVLSGEVTLDITGAIGDVRYAFSGDDHDYCELKHMRFPSGGGGIREITVKSLSWAMGVRRPGFQLVGLWNPVDEEGLRIEGPIDTPTLQSKMCLLPDQLGIIIRYGLAFAGTLVILLVRARYLTSHPERSPFAGSEEPLLPSNSPNLQHHSNMNGNINIRPLPEAEEASTSSSEDGFAQLNTSGRRSRANTLQGRTGSPAISLFGPPSGSGDGKQKIYRGYFPQDEEAKKPFLGAGNAKMGGGEGMRPLKGKQLFLAEFRWALLRILFIGLPWYMYLIWADV